MNYDDLLPEGHLFVALEYGIRILPERSMTRQPPGNLAVIAYAWYCRSNWSIDLIARETETEEAWIVQLLRWGYARILALGYRPPENYFGPNPHSPPDDRSALIAARDQVTAIIAELRPRAADPAQGRRLREALAAMRAAIDEVERDLAVWDWYRPIPDAEQD
ncbi:MAG TPA: hypothetical protein VGE07_16715 [Herpetosiphonaceae bacterium]